MKKIAALIIAVSMMTAAFSCSDNNQNQHNTEETSVSEQLYFKEAEITMSDDFSSIISIDKYDDRVLVFGESKSGDTVGYLTDKGFSEYEIIDFKPKSGEIIKSACLGKFDRTAVLTYLDGKTFLYVFDRFGEIVVESDLDDLIPDQDISAVILSNDDGFIISIDNQTLAAVDKDGEYSGDIDLKGMSVFGFSRNSEGIPTAILNSPDNVTEIASVEELAFGESHKCSNISSSAFAICGGVGQYSLIANFGNGLYALNGDEWVKLTDFTDFGFSGYELLGIISTGETEFAVMIYTAEGIKLKLLTEGDITALKAKKKITLATFSNGYGLDTSVKAFNDSNENYRVELKSYSSEGGNYTDSAEMMRRDILAGDAPDIIQNYIGGMTVDSFGARESLFVDMYELLDKDEKISRDDFIDGYLEALDFRGKLLKISPCFNIHPFAIKDKFLGGLTEWNTTEMIKIIKERPEHTEIFPECEHCTRTNMLLHLVDYCSFIDYEKAECYFDSPEFINVMKQIQENEIGLTEAEFNAMIGDAEIYFFESPGNSYRYFWDDNYLLKGCYITTMGSFLYIVKGEFNEPVTFMGMPNDMGAGLSFRPDEHITLSIMKSCENIDGAWEFIRDSFFSESFYHDYYAKGNLPAIEKYLDEQIEETKELIMYEDETGKLENFNFYPLDNESEERFYFDPFTDEEAQKYGDLVREAAKCERRIDSVVYNIMDEELDAYFNGERSAEEAADIIQNRLSIYLSENYG